MTLKKMGDSLYDVTVLEDGSTRLHRMTENELNERRNIPKPAKPSDVVRIEYHCCGCEADFEQNIPPRKGDANMSEVYRHFEVCGKGVDWKLVKRNQISE